jgi:superfamily II DNA or RNA helicase
MDRAKDRGNRSIFIAHRDDLITATLRRLEDAGIRAGRIQAGYDEDPDAQCQVASLWTLENRECPPAGLLIFDECHRAACTTYRNVAAKYPRAAILGLTATPQRGDGIGLCDSFDRIVAGPSIASLVSRGVLVPCAVYGPSEPVKELAQDPVEAVVQYNRGATAVFTASVEASRALVASLVERGIRARHVDADSDDREDVLDGFAAGTIDVVSNCMLLTEGWDAPRCSDIVLARGCSHAGSWLQIVGRARRAFAGKTDCRIIDLRGNVHLHGLPDADREYSLAGKGIKAAEAKIKLMTCKACGAIYAPAPKCPRCGAIQPMPRPPRVKRRSMIVIDSAHVIPDAVKRGYFESLVREQRAKNYKPGWVFFRFKSRFGHGPPWQIRTAT